MTQGVDATATESPDTEATEVLVERLFGAVIASVEVASVCLGDRLGLYQALATGGAATSGELAARTGTAERYVREWLEQQAVAGLLTVDNGAADPVGRRYTLPAAHRPVLVDADDLNYLAPLAGIAVDVTRPWDEILAAYHSGAGVPFEAYGRELVGAIGAVNRPQFHHLMAGWLAAVPGVDDRLAADPPARVADVAAGTAQSSIAIARAYPRVTVDAIDVDAASVDAARVNVADARLEDRVHPILLDAGAGDLLGDGTDRYDLVTIFEALHDMNHPVAALRAARASLAEGGCVVVADERVAETFAAPGDELERLNYGFSILHCLAVGMLDDDSAGTGTVIRPATVHAYATEAGFGTVEVLPIEHDFWRFYRLQR